MDGSLFNRLSAWSKTAVLEAGVQGAASLTSGSVFGKWHLGVHT